MSYDYYSGYITRALTDPNHGTTISGPLLEVYGRVLKDGDKVTMKDDPVGGRVWTVCLYGQHTSHVASFRVVELLRL
jgi:hypothetical protein